MAIIHHGQTLDEDYVEYMARRLRAYLWACKIPGHVTVTNGDEGMYLTITTLGIEDADLENLPYQVGGILVMLI